MVVSVRKARENPYYLLYEENSSGFIAKSKELIITRRQDAPKVLQLNGFFTYNVKRFLKFKNQYPPKGLPLEIPAESGIMIDTELEFRIVEMMMKQKFII